MRAYVAGEPFPCRTAVEMDDLIIRVPELADRLGVGSRAIYPAVAGERWRLVPEPDGRFGSQNYWCRPASRTGSRPAARNAAAQGARLVPIGRRESREESR